MKPRIFVSSTFYDLKYIREDLSNFIEMHDFEPVLFENGDIGYTPGKKLDQSCYEQMASTDMVILVIGGHYGSPASEEIEDEFKEYMSVTRKEFQTAVNAKIPVFAFVDSAVYAEYGVYEANYEQIEQYRFKLAFRSTKNVNVFRFIREIKGIGNISITEFKKVTDIKEFLSKQWADMFKNYLLYLRKTSEDAKMSDTVSELKTLVKQMNVMLDTVGSKILGSNNSKEYKDVVKLQQVISTADKIAHSMCIGDWYITDSYETRNKNIEYLLNVFRGAIKEKIWDVNGNSLHKILLYFVDRDIRIKRLLLPALSGSFYEEIKVVLNDISASYLLQEELIRDENYKQLCYVAVSADMEEKKQN